MIQSIFNKDEVTKRFCLLSEKVMEQVFKYNRPADCFCNESQIPDEHFIYSVAVMEFIEKAVNEQILNHKIGLDEHNR